MTRLLRVSMLAAVATSGSCGCASHDEHRPAASASPVAIIDELEQVLPPRAANLTRLRREDVAREARFFAPPTSSAFQRAVAAHYEGNGSHLKLTVHDRQASEEMTAAGDLVPAAAPDGPYDRERMMPEGFRVLASWGSRSAAARRVPGGFAGEWASARILVGSRFVVEAESRGMTLESTADWATLLARRVTRLPSL